MYLREIADHELLAAQEEVALAQRLEAAKRRSKSSPLPTIRSTQTTVPS
ncbi:MAG: hypothetical protein JO023_24880 [Chloroflexi bacterium]|nr:hypothetical protein [Chloroflexota bacterium]